MNIDETFRVNLNHSSCPINVRLISKVKYNVYFMIDIMLIMSCVEEITFMMQYSNII